jgi:general secretion pathway protein G
MRTDKRRSGGFTLIELLVVLAIVALLSTLAMPRYFQSIDTAKETILAENLHTTRDTIDKFFGDTGRYPDSLNELVDKNYLRSLPRDPITESTSDWVLIAPDSMYKGKVFNLKSSAVGVNHAGVAYADM